MAASILKSTEEETFKVSIENLKSGKLVSFPTETVYGLGAHALNENAVLSIFQAKGRPLTDPVIIHISPSYDVKSLLKFSHPNQEIIFETLCKTFWPGPLTIVTHASSIVPSVVCAGTGFVSVRCPNHPIALKLLSESKLPIAAPSANRFGHVSPTTASHVMSDLGNVESLIIIDGGRCDIGVESSVVKIGEIRENFIGSDESQKCYNCDLIVLRRGAISSSQINDCLKSLNHSIHSSKSDSDSSSSSTSNQKPDIRCYCHDKDQSNTKKLSSIDHNIPLEAPGQNLKHYAPEHPTFLINPTNLPENLSSSSYVTNEELTQSFPLSSTVVIDFGGYLSKIKQFSLYYSDLSEKEDFQEAAFKLFDELRITESVENAKCVVLCSVLDSKFYLSSEIGPAVYDRMFRAASGQFGLLK